MTARRTFLVILVIYLILSVAYSVAQPLGEAPDEADHYAYVRYLGLNRQLPVGPEVTQSKHPPLYHAAAAALTFWTGLDFDFLRSNPDAFPPGPDAPPNFFVHTTLESFPWRGGALAMHLGRLLSVLLGAVTVWTTWRLGRELFPERAEVGLLAAAFLAGLPGFLYIAGAMSNDNAAAAFGSLALLLLAQTLRRGASWKRSLGLGLVFGLGLLSKVGTLALWPLAILALAGAFWPQRRQPRAWLLAAGHAALAWGLGLLVASPWLLRNWRLYGDPMGWSLVRATVDQRPGPLTSADLMWLGRGLFTYFWGRFGPIGQVSYPAPLYILCGLFSLLLALGAVHYLRRLLPREPRSIFGVMLLAAAPGLVILSIVQYSTIALGTDQARLMWPGIVAIAGWVGLGVAGGAHRFRLPSRALVPVFIGLMAAFGLAVLLFVLRPAFAPGLLLSADAAAAQLPLATFGEGMELLAAELPVEPIAAGEPLPLRLLWRARMPLSADLRPVVRLVHEDGWLAAEWDHSPAQGRFATDRWQPGKVVADPYQLRPNPTGPGIYRVLVGVRPFRGEWLSPTPPASGPFVMLGTVTYQ